MEIILKLLKSEVETDVAEGRSPFFEVYWHHGNEYYPDRGWMDFGVIVIGWWLVAIMDLLSGREEVDLTFMDGPYKLTARRVSSDQVAVRNDEVDWLVSIDSMADTLVSSARAAIDALKNKGIDSAVYSSLEKGIRQLEAMRRSKS